MFRVGETKWFVVLVHVLARLLRGVSEKELSGGVARQIMRKRYLESSSGRRKASFFPWTMATTIMFRFSKGIHDKYTIVLEFNIEIALSVWLRNLKPNGSICLTILFDGLLFSFASNTSTSTPSLDLTQRRRPWQTFPLTNRSSSFPGWAPTTSRVVASVASKRRLSLEQPLQWYFPF